MTAFYVGDIPAAPLVVEPYKAGEPLDLSRFNGAEVRFTVPGLTSASASGFIAEVGEDIVVVQWPDKEVTPFPYEGVYTLRITLTSEDGNREALEPVSIIAQSASNGWHNLDSARAEWDGAPSDDRELYELLTVAREQCEAYAPAMESSPPIRFRAAHLMQTRNLWNSYHADPNGQFGDGSFTIRPFPMDRVVMNILRPRRVVGLVG